MKVTTKQSEIKDTNNRRIPNIFTPPEEWRGDTLGLDRNRAYTVSKKVSLDAISTFGAKKMVLSVLQNDGPTSFSLRDNRPTAASCDNARNGKNCITIGEIKICEHVLSFQQGLNLKLSYNLSENSFPSFDNGLQKILLKIKPFLTECTNIKYLTVKRPILFKFDNGGYIILEPDDGKNELIIDHQFSHKKSIGEQRVVATISPEFFSYISEARAPAFGIRTRFAKLLLDTINTIPFLGLNDRNIVLIDGTSILNPNKKFEHEGVNREPLMHEIIDKIGALSLLGDGKFVGKITTYFTNHKKDIRAMEYLTNNNFLVRQG